MTHTPATRPVWTEAIRICSYDVDFTQQATVVSLCRYFLEAAWNHAEALGVGFAHLAAQNKFWVLSRLRMEMRATPAWGSRATLRTWPRPVTSVFAMRDFEFASESGSRLAAGSSGWLVLDSVSKRPQRLQKLLPGLTELDDYTALERDPEKLADHGTWGETLAVAVRYTDIDVNQHVNASRYVGWTLDTYPEPFHRAHAVRSLEVNYLGETVSGETLIVRSHRAGPDVWIHSLINASGTEVCRARLEWAKRG